MGTRIKDAIFTDKWYDILADNSRILFIEGPTGTGKSLLATIKLYAMAMTLPAHKDKIALIGESITTLEKNFITSDMGMINLFPNVEYKKAGTGGSRIEVKTENGIKLIELYGASNVASWKKLLGGTHFAYMADEINIFHPDLISELWVRIFRNGANLVCTSNGDLPDKFIYTEYLNFCKPVEKYIKYPDIPAGTLKDMAEQDDKPGWVYYFMGFRDNPMYTEQNITDLHNSVVKGSFRYITKILGARAAQEGAVFAELLTDYGKNLFVKDYDQDDFQEVFIGLDMGSGGKNIVTATAIKKGFKGTLTLDAAQIDKLTHDGIIDEINKFVEGFYSRFGSKISHHMIDDGLKHFINKFNATKQHKTIRCQFAIKPKHVDRVAYVEQALHNKTHNFVDTPGNRRLVSNLNKIMTDGKGGVEDKNQEPNDWYDSWCYTFTPRLAQLIKYI